MDFGIGLCIQLHKHAGECRGHWDSMYGTSPSGLRRWLGTERLNCCRWYGRDVHGGFIG